MFEIAILSSTIKSRGKGLSYAFTQTQVTDVTYCKAKL